MKRDESCLLEFLLELNQMAFRYLLEIKSGKKNTTGKLIFPSYSTSHRKGEERISEQELRFAYTTVLERSGIFQPYFYSVETPTEETYAFSKGALSARSAVSDLSLYEKTNDPSDPITYTKVCNIECKALNPSDESIRKDIEKLVKEKENCAWGHLLINQDKGTLEGLFRKFISAFSSELKMFPEDQISSDKAYFFAICILGDRLLLTRKIEPEEIRKDLLNIFSIDYVQLKEAKTGRQDINGWQVELFPEL